MVEGATFLILCHDDVEPDPDAVRVLVEEAYRSNAGIVGPKLVSAEDPGVLLEVGRAIDRFGAPYTGIEPGEFDQEQHDGVRDVFYVTTATMLVRVDLFEQLGGFDPATFPGAEDLDLCWRARLVGARVLVAPDARVAHREAAESRGRADLPDESARARSRVRVLLTSYSFLTLLWLVPVGIVVGFIEAAADLLTGRPRRAARRDHRVVLQPLPLASAARLPTARAVEPPSPRSRPPRVADRQRDPGERVRRPPPARRRAPPGVHDQKPHRGGVDVRLDARPRRARLRRASSRWSSSGRAASSAGGCRGSPPWCRGRRSATCSTPSGRRGTTPAWARPRPRHRYSR